jgi:hypothetical protein
MFGIPVGSQDVTFVAQGPMPVKNPRSGNGHPFSHSDFFTEMDPFRNGPP